MADDPNESTRPEMSFGTFTGAAPALPKPGSAFRIAILGDFTGRANRGERLTADEIAELKPRRVDFDSLDDVIAALQPKVRLPVAGGRSFVDLEFESLDDFHADSLFEKVELIDTVQGIGRRVGRSLEKAMKLFERWADAPLPEPVTAAARGITIPLVDDLSGFQSVAAEPTFAESAVAADDGSLLEPLCAPYIRPVVSAGDADKTKLAEAAAEATNAVAREILHHPDFQTVEGAWRELEWLLRRTDKEPNIEVVLFDVPAEDFAADLSTDGDLAETGLYRLLVEKIAEGVDPEAWSVIVGRYRFDLNSVHSQLLGRAAKIAQRLNAPFLTGFTNALLEPGLKIKDKDLVKVWTELRALPESAWLGIGLPGFLLRMPYGKKGKSVDAFPLEEFLPAAGGRGFLWGNPGTFCAALLARSCMQESTRQFDPNAHRVLDRLQVFALQLANGDAVSFCSEKQFGASTVELVSGLGLMPLQAMKGRDSIVVPEIKSLNPSAAALRGPWSGDAPAAPAPAAEAEAAGDPTVASAEASAAPEPAAADAAASDDSGMDPELAALLGDSADSSAADNSGLDPELAALLGETPGDSADSSAADNSGLDPELAALLGETPASDSSSSATDSGDDDDDDGLDPELAALLNG